MSSLLNFDVLATDYIRTLRVPPQLVRRPLCITYVGLPGSGKSFVTTRLAQKFALIVLREEDLTNFLSPHASLLERGAVEVFQLAIKTIEQLVKAGRACSYDANLKSREQRDLIKKVVEDYGGVYVLIHIATSKELCYERVQKQNLAVTRGEDKGLILDKDYFEYEVATTRRPATDEPHLIYDGETEENIAGLISAVAQRVGL